MRKAAESSVFYHPDYTVGSGITPDQPTRNGRLMDYTIGREFHPAPKTIYTFNWILIYTEPSVKCACAQRQFML